MNEGREFRPRGLKRLPVVDSECLVVERKLRLVKEKGSVCQESPGSSVGYVEPACTLQPVAVLLMLLASQCHALLDRLVLRTYIAAIGGYKLS
jgi:hypothetical protein